MSNSHVILSQPVSQINFMKKKINFDETNYP